MYFCFTSNENCHFSSEKRDPAKRVVDFPRERDTFRNKIMEIVENFDEKSYNNGKPWKSSRILRLNPNFFIFLSFFIISLHFSFFHCFHFFIFSVFHFLLFSFIFFHVRSFSIMFIHVPSFSFIFLHFPSFSLSLWGAQKNFFGPQFRYDFS